MCTTNAYNKDAIRKEDAWKEVAEEVGEGASGL